MCLACFLTLLWCAVLMLSLCHTCSVFLLKLCPCCAQVARLQQYWCVRAGDATGNSLFKLSYVCNPLRVTNRITLGGDFHLLQYYSVICSALSSPLKLLLQVLGNGALIVLSLCILLYLLQTMTLRIVLAAFTGLLHHGMT